MPTGSISFAIGIANDHFYDSDTNDQHGLAYHALNDSFAQAQTVGGASEIYGYANHLSDRFDYYYIEGFGNGGVGLTLASGNSDLDLFVYDQFRNPIGSSTGLGTATEAISNVDLPVYIMVDNYDNHSSDDVGSRYNLTTNFPTGSTVSSTSMRFRVNLIEPATQTKLWGDGVYTTVLVVSSPGTNYAVLENVPVGTYDFQFASNSDIDDDPQGDVAFGFGILGNGTVTVLENQQAVRSVILE